MFGIIGMAFPFCHLSVDTADAFARLGSAVSFYEWVLGFFDQTCNQHHLRSNGWGILDNVTTCKPNSICSGTWVRGL
ncbi:uncharacterized protein BKA78DRAFT_315216 [Phyllosticta capitalensis]|uniref:uncharacterized protein n=1 Tax=Phyllosticta capitalensis TaxID=121624 RepID=UPI00313028A7